MSDQFAKNYKKRRSPYLVFYSTTQFPGLGNVFGTLAEENTSDKDIRASEPVLVEGRHRQTRPINGAT